MATADLESYHIWEGPGWSKRRSRRSWRIQRVSLSASMQPKNSASALERVTERCILLNQWNGQPMKK
eukprot:scaffold66189_cov36-Phaeocystis_antarctica.AAC.1